CPTSSSWATAWTGTSVTVSCRTSRSFGADARVRGAGGVPGAARGGLEAPLRPGPLRRLVGGLGARGGGADGAVTRYDARWPHFASRSHVETRRERGPVVVSCLLSDIAHEWAIEPRVVSCGLRVTVRVPEDEAGRIARRARRRAPLA